MSDRISQGEARDNDAVSHGMSPIQRDQRAEPDARVSSIAAEPPSASALEDLLSGFESTDTPTDEDQYAAAFRKLRDGYVAAGIPVPNAVFAELLAFAVHAPYPDSPTRWGTYFGPIMTGQSATGEPWEAPNRTEITDDMLEYWRHRASKARHPIMRARYADLIWELPPVLSHVQRHERNPGFAHMAIDAYLEGVSSRRYEHDIVLKDRAERALALSVLVRNAERIVRARDTLVALEGSIARDEFAGLWGFSFDALVAKPNKYVPVPDVLRDGLINDLEQRLARFATTAPHQYHPHGPEAAALRLAEYYRRQNRPDDAQRVLGVYETIVFAMEAAAAPFVAAHSVEQLYGTYIDFGLRERADALNPLMQRLGKATHEAMTEHSVSIDISPEKIDAYFDALLAGSEVEVLKRIALQFLPRRAHTQTQVLDLAKKAPLMAMLGRKIVDGAGRTIAIIGSVENDLDGNIVHQTSENLRIGAGFLHDAIQRGLDRGSFTIEGLLAAVFASHLIRQDRHLVVERGLLAGLRGDDTFAAHLLVPQIEAAIREAAGFVGTAIYKPRRGGGLHLRTLDELLRDIHMVDALGEDFTSYLRVLLTDQRAWNVRNSVAHGLLGDEAFGPVVSDRLVHVFLLFGEISAVEDHDDGGSSTAEA